MNPEQPNSESKVENIECAVIIFHGEVFKGKSHPEIILEVEKKYPNWLKSGEEIQDVFMTNSGRIVSRQEAGKIAKASMQLEHLNVKTQLEAVKNFDSEDLFSNALDLTRTTYNGGFKRYEESTPTEVSGEAKEWMDTFESYLPGHSTIFELGSATGRDARYFTAKGHDVFCTDIIPEALEKLSKEEFQTDEFDFRNEPKEKWLNQFDAVFANGVLLHAPQATFEKALNTISKILKEDGVAAFSLKTGEGEELSEEKMNAPRYFNYHSEEDVRETLSKLPFAILHISYPENGKWICLIIRSTK